jgi:hypothetical protein
MLPSVNNSLFPTTLYTSGGPQAESVADDDKDRGRAGMAAGLDAGGRRRIAEDKRLFLNWLISSAPACSDLSSEWA